MLKAAIPFLVGLSALVSCQMFYGDAAQADEVDFLRKHCLQCHDAANHSADLNLERLPGAGLASETFATWVRVHDRVAAGEMPPQNQPQPAMAEKQQFLQSLDNQLQRDDAARQKEQGRVRLRRLTRQEFQNTLIDLLALPRLEIISLLPADGRVSGYHKIGSGLDLSPSHLVAYRDAVERALDIAIATRSTPPPVTRHRVYPAGLFKFGANLIEGQFVLLKDKAPEPALPVRCT